MGMQLKKGDRIKMLKTKYNMTYGNDTTFIVSWVSKRKKEDFARECMFTPEGGGLVETNWVHPNYIQKIK